jgi:hypothetical protein
MEMIGVRSSAANLKASDQVTAAYLILDKWNRAYAENIGFERFKRGN